MRIREILSKQKLGGICTSILLVSLPAMNLLKCFLNKFVYSEKKTFQAYLFVDPFNYCHVDNEASSHPSTHT